MKDRLSRVREKAEISQEVMADKLGLSRNYISLMERGKRIPSDRTISDICREFHVNEKWLRTGEGEMEPDATHRQKLNNFFTDVLATAPDERSAFVAALADLPPEFWGLVADLARKYAETLIKKAD